MTRINRRSASYWLFKLIPEFVVVVLGVVVALGVDNMRQGYSERKLKDEYTESMINAAAADTILLHEELKRLRVKDSCTRKLINIITLTNQNKDSADLRTILLATVLIDPPLSFAIFDDLMSTGNINVFKDIKQKQRIIEIYTFMKFSSQWLRDIRLKNNQQDVYPVEMLKPFALEYNTLRMDKMFIQNLRDISNEIKGNQEMLDYLYGSLMYCHNMKGMIGDVFLGSYRDLIAELKNENYNSNLNW